MNAQQRITMVNTLRNVSDFDLQTIAYMCDADLQKILEQFGYSFTEGDDTYIFA